DCSVDYVVAMETLDDLLEPGKFLAEARRILRPSGRIMVSVLQQRLDQEVEPPQRRRLNVYDVAKLCRQIATSFDLEIVWSQAAGKRSAVGRPIQELVTQEDAPDAEYLLALAMKSPLGNGKGEYHEPAFPQAERTGGHVVAFGKWYHNPWLVRGLVT